MTEQTISTADLYDERGAELDCCELQFLNLGGREAFSGPIRTVRCFEDNSVARELLATPGDGAVLVIDGRGSTAVALMGDMVAESAVANGWAGVIINGAVRDRAALAKLDLGIRALGSNPRKSEKHGIGQTDVPVVFGGCVFTPGKQVWSDIDGILVER